MEKLALGTTIALSLLLFLLLLSNASTSQRVTRAVIHNADVSQAYDSRHTAVASSNSLTIEEVQNLDSKLRNAVLDGQKHLQNRTVIIATLNQAWAEGGIFDNFLESFHNGENIAYLLDHLVVVSLDTAAYSYCLTRHRHCFNLSTPGVDLSAEGVYMSQSYLQALRRKIQFLGAVLKLGFSFIFTDVDMIWFRAPFKHFSQNSDVDVSCNHDFNGNSSDLDNQPNTGLLHVRSNPRSIQLFDEWYKQHGIYPEKHDQDVLNTFKFSEDFQSTGIRMKFVPTEYFSGYCRLNSDMEKVCTMHATCCVGQENKLVALRASAEDWKLFMARTPQEAREAGIHFRSPTNCL